jgi:hypothetical protein
MSSEKGGTKKGGDDKKSTQQKPTVSQVNPKQGVKPRILFEGDSNHNKGK